MGAEREQHPNANGFCASRYRCPLERNFYEATLERAGHCIAVTETQH